MEDWRGLAACLDHPAFATADFYEPEPAPQNLIDLCVGCPVRPQCREWAIGHELFGFWAGMTERERATERRSRRVKLPDEARLFRMARATRPPSHGTLRGHKAHRDAGEQSCDLCTDAYLASRVKDRKRRLAS